MTAFDKGELGNLTGSFKDRLSRGEPMDDLLPEAFAAVREAARRSIGQRPFDVQIMGGAVLHLGKIAEMRTGEGKTLTITLPAYLHALSGNGVHVMTANDYLASRDAEWMRPVYEALGLTVGLLEPGPRPDPPVRRAEYNADVTYGPWSEFSYDYLRDSLAWSQDDVVQRGHRFVIVDEADLILIDEMRSSLQISGPVESADKGKLWQQVSAGLATRLGTGNHYESDPRAQTVSLTDSGAQTIEVELGIDNLYDERNLPLVHYLLNALKAKELYQKDRDYVVADGQAVIIDQTSGRLHHGRRYADGIHEAIEAKEGLEIRPETQMLATAPMWDYLGQYQHLAGLTGTAQEDAETYHQIYRRDVVAIPTNKPMIRVDHADAIYRTRDSKLSALAAEVGVRHATGQPVLVGATSVEEAEAIAGTLTQRDIAHQVLTAWNFDQEARVIAAAGALGAVTVVAKMAGRGVDIILGGADGGDRERVADLGGLCVLGAERPAKRRLEMHLRGRAGRQGDPGEAQFFVSYDDELVRAAIGKNEKYSSFLRRITREGDHISRFEVGLTSLQGKTAANEAAWLVQACEWDRVLTDQRHLIYADRLPAVRGDDMSTQVRALIGEVIRAEVADAAATAMPADQLWRRLRELYPVSLTPEGGALPRHQQTQTADLAAADAQRAYSHREAELGIALIRDVERRVILVSLDRGWREHLQALPDLAKSIGIRASGPAALAEYRREGTSMFNRMRQDVNRRIVGALFYARVRESDLGVAD